MKEKYNFILNQINELNNKACLVAVSKKQPTAAIRKLYDLGCRNFAENYLNEFLEKKKDLDDLEICWHYIGSLQTKKIKKIVPYFDWIHSVESQKHVMELEKQCAIMQKQVSFLIQINLAHEESKSGASISDLDALLDLALQGQFAQFKGFMFMPPLYAKEEEQKEHFDEFYDLTNSFLTKRSLNSDAFQWSMGTSHDYPVALSCGATMIRVGSSLFGPRT